ncbi:alkylated DNA repair dioxygenase AlkB [Bradyrhizobium ottawaense]
MTASHVSSRVICKSHQPPLGSITEMRGMTQLGLFAVPDEGPTGLRHMDNFIEAAVEQALIGRIAALPLERFQFGAFEGNRRVASFGYRYDYTLQRLAEAEPIPDWLLPVARQAEAWAKLPEASVRQVLCTEYEAGVGIGWHRDKPHFDKILGLSLGSACNFRFRAPQRRQMAAPHARGPAALAVHDGRRGALAMGAQYPAGRGAPLLHHVPDDEAGVTRPARQKMRNNPMQSKTPVPPEARRRRTRV